MRPFPMSKQCRSFTNQLTVLSGVHRQQRQRRTCFYVYSALVVDPRTTLVTPEFETSCQKANVQMITTDVDAYNTHILAPFFSLFDKQWSEANRVGKMYLPPFGYVQRIVHTLWFSLRTLKQNDQISKLFDQTILWKTNDQEYVQSLQPPPPNLVPKKRKKKILVKTGNRLGDVLSNLSLWPYAAVE